MRIALITTTIRIPRVLEQYRRLDKEAMFFVVGDQRTPHGEARSFVEGLGNAVYYSDTQQEKLGYCCSEIIGWNKIMRRNIALLEAIKWGADIIISIDDDNIPLSQDYFTRFEHVLLSPYDGILARSSSNWFNIGDFLSPQIYHRGFPYEYRNFDLGVELTPVCEAKVGVAAGLWFGDPDVDAMERITRKRAVRQMSELLKTGVVVDHSCFTPFNSQNTAYVADLAPLMMVWIGVGRYDDIWAAYVAQRIMQETAYHVYFGTPFVWQQRNPHNLWQNLKDEIYGMENTSRFCEDLRAADLGDGIITAKLHRLYEHLRRANYLPSLVHELGKAWLDDLEKVFRR
jgi:hypothetical protein